MRSEVEPYLPKFPNARGAKEAALARLDDLDAPNFRNVPCSRCRQPEGEFCTGRGNACQPRVNAALYPQTYTKEA